MGLNLHLVKMALGRLKQADVPAPAMSATQAPMPPAPPPPPTNAAALPPQQPVTQQTPTSSNQSMAQVGQPPITTSQGAANVPAMPQNRAQTAFQSIQQGSGQSQE